MGEKKENTRFDENIKQLMKKSLRMQEKQKIIFTFPTIKS